MHGGMSEGMQMVPGFNDPIWKVLLAPPLCGSRVPPSVASRPCLAAPVSMKPEVVSSEAVRRALYSAALDFVSSSAGVHRQCNQPRLVLPRRHPNLHQHRLQPRQAPTYGDLVAQRQQPIIPDIPHFQRHAAPVTSFVTSSIGDLQDGMHWRNSFIHSF